MKKIYTFFCCLVMLLTTSQLSATNFDVVNTGSNMTVFVTPNTIMTGDFEDVSQIGIFYTNDAGELACAGTSSFLGSGAFQITLWGSEAGLGNGMADGEELTWLASAQNGYLYNVTPTYQGENMNTYTLNAISFIVGIDFALDTSSVIEGCMDGHSSLHNPAANLHNEDMCTSDVVLGCTDELALNYNSDATEDDGSCEYATPLVITTTVCTEASSVMMTGPWWGWDPLAGPVAASNGDGTWTFTFDVAPDADMEYLLVVDGVQENLVEANTASEDWSCTPVTDYWSYANRQWTVGSGDVLNVYGTCGSECPTVEPEPTTASVEFTVDMNGVDQPSADYDQVTVNGSWNGWGAWGLPLTDEDADGIFTGTLELEAGTSFEYVVAVSGSADSWSGWGIQWGDGCSNANVSVTLGEVGSVTSSSLTPGCAEVLGCMDANATNYDSGATAQAYDQYGNLGCVFTSCDDIPEYGCIYGDGFGAFNAEFNADACVTYGGTPCEAAPTCEGTEATLTLMDSYGDGGGSVTIAGTNYELFTGSSEDFALCLDLSSCIAVTFVATDIYPGENSWSISDASGAVLAGAVAGDALFGSCVVGCMDASALNFDATAVIADNTLCEYSACEADEATLTLMDSYGDGGGSVTIAGTNYVLAAGSSEDFPLCIDLSSCLTVTFVATDNWTTENSWSISDASGVLASGADADGLFGGCVTACGDETAENYNADADIVDNTLCEYSLVQGCMDETACNFDASAEADNGTCEYPEAGFDCEGNCASGTLVTVDGGSYLGEKSWTITSCDGSELLSGGAPFAGCADLSGSYTIDLVDSFGDGWDGTVMTIGESTYTVESGATASFDMGCAILGCTDATATNFNAEANTDDGSCEYVVIVEGCTDATASNYNDEATDDDGSCISWADVAADLQAQLDAIVPEDGVTQADVDAVQALLDAIVPEDGVTQADLDAQADLSYGYGYGDGAGSVTPEDGISQADVDAVQALLDAIVPEDGVTQADLDAAVSDADAISSGIITDLQAQLDDALASACAPIFVDIVEGWNILGYTLPYGQDVAATLSSIELSIEIVKDNDAAVYWPEFGFNGIGDFIPGQGYQIKTNAATANYTWPNINGERIDMSPTVPQWAADMEVDVHPNDIRSLVKVVNMLGQEVNVEDQFTGEVVLYLYNDGTVEKKIVQ
jgi:hypothetical protein